MFKLIGLFALFCITFSNAQKVPVQIYYESLCEDSQAFVTKQLYPALTYGLKDFIDIEWIPFGKSTYETRGSDVIFQCHHGPNECYGNKVHACAIQHIQVSSYQNEHTRESMTLEYINCLMKAGKSFEDNIYPGEKCAKEVNLRNWIQIAECANSTEGSKLLQKYGDLTAELNPPLKSVPTVLFRRQRNPDVQNLALTDFAKALCAEISTPKPQVCAAHNGVGSINSVLTPIITFLTFISSRLIV